MVKNPFQWEHPKAKAYNDTIRMRIAGYELLFDLNMDMLANESLSEKSRVLIVGAGGGQELSVFARNYPSCYYAAVDPSENMLELAKFRLQQEELQPRVDMFADKLEQIQFEEPFDIATCHLVLHFIKNWEDKKSLLQSISQNLRPGAQFFLTSINTNTVDPNFSQQLRHWQQTMLRNGVSEKEWVSFAASFDDTLHAIPLNKLIELLQNVGFTNIIPYFKTHLVDGLIMTKK